MTVRNLSLAARGAARGIIEELDACGELHLGSEGLPRLAIVLGRPWPECEPAVREVLDAELFFFDPELGVLVQRKAGT